MNVLEKAVKLEKDADEFGFSWENPQQIMAQISSECQEIQEHLQVGDVDYKNNQDLQEEIGDLFHAVLSLCVFCKYSVEDTVEISVDKFERRLATVKQIATENGVQSFKGLKFAELMQYWDEAKLRLKDLV